MRPHGGPKARIGPGLHRRGRLEKPQISLKRMLRILSVTMTATTDAHRHHGSGCCLDKAIAVGTSETRRAEVKVVITLKHPCDEGCDQQPDRL